MSKKNKKVIEDKNLETNLDQENNENQEVIEDKKWKFFKEDSKIVSGAKKAGGFVKRNGKKIVGGVVAGAVVVGAIAYELTRSKDDTSDADDYVTLLDDPDDQESIGTDDSASLPFNEDENQEAAS